MAEEDLRCVYRCPVVLFNVQPFITRITSVPSIYYHANRRTATCLPPLKPELCRCLKASNLLIVFGIDIRQNVIGPLTLYVSIRTGQVGVSYERTGGIWLGISITLVMLVAPFFNGHSRSTFLICSHKSASWLIKVTRFHLTCRCTFAPSSTS